MTATVPSVAHLIEYLLSLICRRGKAKSVEDLLNQLGFPYAQKTALKAHEL
jgi:hypothetical protein